MMQERGDAMSDDVSAPDPDSLPIRARKPRRKFKAPATAQDDRREVKMYASKALHIAIRMEAAKKDTTVNALLMDGLRRSFPALALVIDRELKEAERKHAA
jgi:hypothetical protein